MSLNNRISVCWVSLVFFMMAYAFSAENDVGLVLQMPTTYVDASQPDNSGAGTSWATAKQTIQAAIDSTAQDGTVWVTNGTYNIGGAAAPDDAQTNRVYFTRPMTVRSVNGPEETLIIGAAGSNGSNDFNSVRGVLMQANCTLIGFTIADGFTIKTDTYPNFNRDGAGIWMTTNCVVSNCVISNNFTTANGGGVFLDDGLLTDCRITRNQSEYGGGGVRLNYGGTIEDCMIEDNADIGWNGGGGVSIEGYGYMRRSVIRGNSARDGAGLFSNGFGDPAIENCLFVDNEAAESGGGVSAAGSTLNNCTIVGNSVTNQASWQGGGGLVSGMMGMVSLNNCIVWGNTAPTNTNLALQEWGGDTARNSCAPVGEGLTNGVDGCITSDPLFVDSSSGNYQLQAGSPCVNAGDNSYAPAGLDLAGNIRTNNTTVDMGAYEQSAVLPTYTITTSPGANGTMSPVNPVVYQGFDQEINILPALGYRVDTLSVDGTSVPATNSYTFTNVQAAHTITARFALDPHTLTVTSGSGGGQYANAETCTLAADLPELGMAFSHWSVIPVEYTANLGSTTSASTTFTMPAEEVEIAATYAGIVEVKNVSAAQRPGTKLVDISYDLFSGTTNRVSISLSVSNSTVALSSASASEDIGDGVSTGTGKSIIWDAGADWNGQVADLSFTVEGSSGILATVPAVTTQRVDSRTYTLTVNSSLYGEVSKVSRWAAYDVSTSIGSVESTINPVVKSDTRRYEESGKRSSFVSASVGSNTKNTQANIAVMGLLPGTSDGHARVQIDPKAGTIKAGAISRNRGGPSYWRDSYGDLQAYSPYQGWGWGIGSCEGGIRRLYEVTGTSPITLTLNIFCEGDFEAEERTSAGYEAASLVTLVKDLDGYFDVLGDEMSWGFAADMVGDTNAYDWVFGDETQEVASFLLQKSFSGGVNQEDADRHISDGGSYSFTAYPGDYILIDDWISLAAANHNPFEILAGMDRAEVDDFSYHSSLSSDGDPNELTEYTYFEGESIGNPIPAIGTHSNYCWMSTVTCTVDSVEGYANAGWTGTGSVPTSGTSTTTGAIILSNLNSSIAWQWAFDGYELTVENGSGSGTYTNGTLLPIVADAGDFYKWSGDSAELLEDVYAASTTLRMPANNVTFSPIYHPTEVYVNAAMTNDLQDGLSWETAKQTIQAAVDLVALNGTVWVTNGIYDVGAVQANDSGISRVNISRAVTVRSVNGADETVILGEPEWGGIRGVSLSNGCSLVGFTIQNGSTTNVGGGVLLHDGAVVEECRIVNNEAGICGGGVYLDQGGSLNRCMVQSNMASIRGAGIGMSGGSVNNCLISDNGNTDATQGAAGVHMTGGTLFNSTVVSNSDLGGVSGSGDVRNCIVWGNATPNLSITNGVVYTTCADSGVIQDENGCITNDPQFVDATAGNYQLLGTSPCIDAGDTAAAPNGKDLANSTRVINGTVDLGAYERFLVESDSDLDALPDWWELHYYGGVTNAHALQLSSNGVDTIKEAYIAGLDPTNPSSRFLAQVVQHVGAHPVISWPTARGRIYSVYWAPDLATPFTLLAGNIPWTQDGFLDEENGSKDTGFYLIEVNLED